LEVILSATVILPDGKEIKVEREWLLDHALDVLMLEISKGDARKNQEGMFTAHLRDRTLFMYPCDRIDECRGWIRNHRDRFFGIRYREFGKDESL
jgi:hypothetical protein